MKTLRILGLLAIVALVLSGCPAAPQVVEKEVVKEVPVEVVVTATPAPLVAGEDIGKVFVMGPFRAEEETAFNNVIKVFEEQNPGIDVIYMGTAEFETLITVRVEAGDPPDIAAFPQPGAVAKFAREGRLVPLWPEALEVYDEQYTPAWKELSSVDGVPYGMFHRVNAKGWVWYNKPAFEAGGYQVPTTWDELMALTEELKATGIAPWCDGIESGAATGWKGTDWIENLLLRTQPVEVYDKWVAHEIKFDSPEVRKVWEILEGLWMDPELFYGGSQTIALTDFKVPPTWMFGDNPTCWLHMQGSFVTNFFPSDVQANLDEMVGVFMLPPIDPALPFTLEVGGDQYVVFKGKERPEVKKFIEFLGTPASVEPWAKQGGSLFPHVKQDLAWYPTELERTMAEAITKATAARFDGSDMMASELNLAFWKGVTDWVSGARTLDEALADIDAAVK